MEAAKSPEQRAFEAKELARIAKEQAEAHQNALDEKRTAEEVSFFFSRRRDRSFLFVLRSHASASLSLSRSVSLSLSLSLASSNPRSHASASPLSLTLSLSLSLSRPHISARGRHSKRRSEQGGRKNKEMSNLRRSTNLTPSHLTKARLVAGIQSGGASKEAGN